MKFYLKITDSEEDSVTVVCNKVTDTVKRIEELCREGDLSDNILYGTLDDEVVAIEPWRVTCFYTKLSKVYALVDKKEYALKLRIKQLVDYLDDSFIKINQGCIANVKQIAKFKVSLGGALKVVFKNGYEDYVSRRETQNIKRRLGL
jgi:DNA-binding LytR/AlgR family response regulator